MPIRYSRMLCRIVLRIYSTMCDNLDDTVKRWELLC